MTNTFKNYRDLAKRTCVSLESEKLDLAHLVLGMNTEINEIELAIEKGDKINLSEEVADFMWYLANYTRIRKIDKITINKKFKSNLVHLLYNRTSLLQDIVKKYIAYDKEIDRKKEVILINQIYSVLLSFPIDFEKALENNINKLRVRFPEKFNKENAINRNIDEERKELEK